MVDPSGSCRGIDRESASSADWGCGGFPTEGLAVKEPELGLGDDPGMEVFDEGALREGAYEDADSV